MISWILGNLATICISLVLAAVLAGIIIQLIRRRKKGGSCSCGCAACAMKDQCNGKDNP